VAALGIDSDQWASCKRALAAVLCLGNVQIEEAKDGTCHVAETEAAGTAAFLLGCEEDALFDAMCAKKVAHVDSSMLELRRHEALEARDALATALYGGLFAWLLARVNEALGGRAGPAAAGSITVLDLLGFEQLPSNGFTQLCANYSAEKLGHVYADLLFSAEVIHTVIAPRPCAS
jgi:myosin heavy subunit